MKAIICGGGIAGLVSALCLIKKGWDVIVLEQAASYDEIGAGIQLSPNGCKVLAQLALLEQIEDISFAPEKIEMRIGKSGRQVFSIPLKNYAVERWGAPYLHIHRADLIATLKAALQDRAPNCLHTSKKVTGYQNRAEGTAALLDNGDEIEGDLLIGADGIHSTIRQQMLGTQPARFTGNVAWRATVAINSLGDLAPPPTACVWTGKGRHAVTYRLRRGELANFVGVVERNDWHSESWTEQGSRDEALADFKGWHPTVTTLIEQSATHYRWALYDRAPLTQWHDDRAVLIGDACHPMLPFLAQGANMAMEDALSLARLVSENGATKILTNTLAEHFENRITRTSKVQAAAGRNMKTFHQRSAAYLPVQIAAKLKPDIMHKRMDWVYNHDASNLLSNTN